MKLNNLSYSRDVKYINIPMIHLPWKELEEKYKYVDMHCYL